MPPSIESKIDLFIVNNIINYVSIDTAPHADDILSVDGKIVDCRRDRTVYREGEPCTKLYKVVEGAVRICNFREDGCRQIDAFYFPGDYFGFGLEPNACFTAEATTRSVLWSGDIQTILSRNARAEKVAGTMWKLAVWELRRSQNHALLLGYKNAQDRVLAFLKDVARRLRRSALVELPMSRQDIADYLGLTIETVSRSLTELARRDIIQMPRPRSVVIKRTPQHRPTGDFRAPPFQPASLASPN